MNQLRLFSLILFLGISSSFLFGQSKGINYQAVARDGANNLLSNTNLNVRFTILEGATNVFQESQFIPTSEYGLFSAVIGSTDLVAFSAVDWASGEHSLQVEIDPGGGFVDMGTTVLQAVPYSKVATEMKVEDLINVSDSAAIIGQALLWDGTAWTPGDASSVWEETGNNIYYESGNVGIGTTTPSHPLHIVHSTTTQNTISIEAGTPPSARDVFEIKVDAATSDGAQFMEFERGNSIVARVNADGSAEFKSLEFEDGTVQTTAATGPIAYGSVSSAGVATSGSGNYTVNWVAAQNRYEIDITGESYHFASYTTIASPASSTVHRFRTSSVSGKLLVYMYNSAGSLMQANFHFTTFK